MPRLSIELPVSKHRALRKLATEYGCNARELAGVAIEEMLAAHRAPAPTSVKAAPARPTPTPPPAPTPAPAANGRTYQPKPCAACGKSFAPTGPNSKACARCKSTFKADPATPEQREVVWDGTKGRQGASLTSH